MMSNGKHAVLISCSDHYEHRLCMIDHCLQQLGYSTTYITSDFDHTAKQTFFCKVPGCVQIHAMPYKKNLSVQRILSHRQFARDVFRYVETLDRQPDVIVTMLPPNFLGHYAARYKKNHPNVKLIFDIFDLWPETFPSNKAKKLLAPAFRIWSWIRDHSLCAADHIFTECDLFRGRLRLTGKNATTVYLSKSKLEAADQVLSLSDDSLSLCYLGAINNVISIADICGLISAISKSKPVTLHIIGRGERQQEFVDCAKEAGADVIFYGAVYDEDKKQEIMNQCHFGLNIMKSSVCVGLTMKSVDYFRYSLPIINNIPADTWHLVIANHAGFNLDEHCVDNLCSLSAQQCIEMRDHVKHMFETNFTNDVISSKFLSALQSVL